MRDLSDLVFAAVKISNFSTTKNGSVISPSQKTNDTFTIQANY